MTEQTFRAALVGAGYIATWHADTLRTLPGVELTAVCDTSRAAAESFAEEHGVRAFTSLDEMIRANVCDAVHVLTPPSSHRDVAMAALEAGLHVMVEKPAAPTQMDVMSMITAAQRSGVVLGVCHNFLGLPAYLRLKEACRSGAIGRISSAEVNWHFPLVPLRSGPFALWMLREDRNLLLELGPHLYAFVVDLFGRPEPVSINVSKPIELPGGAVRHQSWRILAQAQQVDVAINMSLVETTDDRSLTVRGSSGVAHLDFSNDTLVIDRENTAEPVLNAFVRQSSRGLQSLRGGVRNAASQLISLNRRSPYAVAFEAALSEFYDAARTGSPIDSRFGGQLAFDVVGAIEDAVAPLGVSAPQNVPRPAGSPRPAPRILVIGGTGFIGSRLTRDLVSQGQDVRVLSRSRSGPFDDIADHVEIIGASLKDAKALREAMEGCNVVFHLAKSADKTWAGCLQNDVAVTECIAEAALDAGVDRFIYTGTIASYDMSRREGTITEQTGFAADMSDRSLYARSKALCESRLLDLHRDRGLPLVIARPGIVIGPGGPLQHWGIGKWQGAGAIQLWGNGRNVLPFALLDDVSDGLIRMMSCNGAVGESFNLVGEPMMSARDYFDEIHESLGARVRVTSGSLVSLYVTDSAKYALKRHVLGKKSVERASLRDWRSRAHLTPFDNSKAKQLLGWQPVQDRRDFVRRGIVEANLFGF